MFWVTGLQLNAEVEARLNDPVALKALAKAFREMIRSLEVLGVAHGDLQHGNIIVSNGELRLIDYDGIYVPALAGLDASEFGHQNYQHPQRSAAAFDARLDRFASIVIYTALIALSVDASLWTRFNNDENILFRAKDFESPADSELFEQLSHNSAASAFAMRFTAVCSASIDQVPTLEQIIAGAIVQSIPTTRAAPPPPIVTPQFTPLVTRAAVRQPPISPNRRMMIPVLMPITFALIGGVLASVLLVLLLHASKSQTTPHAGSGATFRPSAPQVAVVYPSPWVGGNWLLNEHNIQYGEMLWSATVTQTGSRLEIDATKNRIAGVAATECERETHLRAKLSLTETVQTIPFDETNCYGTVTRGLVVIAAFSPDRSELSGHFIIDGTRVGDFVARKE